ncbi:MAG: Clp protease ClpP [Gammaproteobacteria bacterium]|nr:Clp protease ClpP [Gammaproteobacteria bacterium]
MFNARLARQAWCRHNGFSAALQARFEAWIEMHEEDRGITAQVSGDELEVNILDVIGYDWWTGGGITTKEVKATLDEAGEVRSIRAIVDSPGGSVFDGIGIHNLFRRHAAYVTIEVVGLAASAASVISMSGDEVQMHVGTEMMIHQASGMTWGNADDHDETAKALRSIDTSLVEIYANKTSKGEEDIAALLKAETWMTATEAVKDGFATKVIRESGTKKKTTASARPNAQSPSRPTAQAKGYRPLRGLL